MLLIGKDFQKRKLLKKNRRFFYFRHVFGEINDLEDVEGTVSIEKKEPILKIQLRFR